MNIIVYISNVLFLKQSLLIRMHRFCLLFYKFNKIEYKYKIKIGIFDILKKFQ